MAQVPLCNAITIVSCLARRHHHHHTYVAVRSQPQFDVLFELGNVGHVMLSSLITNHYSYMHMHMICGNVVCTITINSVFRKPST